MEFPHMGLSEGWNMQRSPLYLTKEDLKFRVCFPFTANEESCVGLLVSHRVPPQVADRGTLARYGGYQGNKIPGADQNQYRCLAVGRGICKG